MIKEAATAVDSNISRSTWSGRPSWVRKPLLTHRLIVGNDVTFLTLGGRSDSSIGLSSLQEVV